MAQNKTRPTQSSVTAFLNGIDDAQQKKDAKKIAAMMREATGKRAKMWGSSIVGFGEYHYKYASGREGDFMIVGFSPRKTSLSLYIMPGFSGYKDELAKLGKYKTGKSCLYIKRLDDVDEKVLKRLIQKSVREMKKKYPTK